MVHGFYCAAGRKEITAESFYQEVQRVLPQVHAPF
jgi:hypothetical protein